MPIQDPSELCGQCHSEARFGWQEWQSSTHYQRNMTCTICHDPHTAALKVVEGQGEEGASALCINCHRQYSMNFSYSIHEQAGINCIDCHLRHYGESGDRDVHTMPDHSFTANLDSCNTCHASQMHTASDSTVTDLETIALTTTEPTGNGQVSDQPSPLSPYGYAGLAGLLGLAGGMILSPWLDKAYRRITKDGRKQ
jgi:predicted CXXCH cytochrome family protein